MQIPQIYELDMKKIIGLPVKKGLDPLWNCHG